MNDITIIIISYKSEKIIYNFIKKIPTAIKIIIIENSQNHVLKKKIEENQGNSEEISGNPSEISRNSAEFLEILKCLQNFWGFLLCPWDFELMSGP